MGAVLFEYNKKQSDRQIEIYLLILAINKYGYLLKYWSLGRPDLDFFEAHYFLALLGHN